MTTTRSRRFGGLQRLYGDQALERLAGAHIMVAGLGGVGTWCAEALARSGVGQLTLVDLDHIAESNINRQLHALSSTLGQSKVQAMAERIDSINPECAVQVVDDFVTPDNVASLFDGGAHIVIDCTDQLSAKVAMILEGRARSVPVLVCGGAGGKTDPLALRSGDLARATHDALLARLRQVLRRHHGFPGAAPDHARRSRRLPSMGVWALWLEQSAVLPAQWQQGDAPQGLSCAGYGSLVAVTASMGMAAAQRALSLLLD